MTKIREFLSIEQALQQAIKDLREDGLKQATGKSEAHFRKCSDPGIKDNQLHHKDAVNIDIASVRKGEGHPLLSVHQALIDKAMKQSNQAGNITQSLLHMGARIGDLMEVTEKAMDPNSPVEVQSANKKKIKSIKP
jgi:hypothetical protein